MAIEFRVFLHDETDCFPENITQSTGRIYGLYIADFAQAVHCCELTPSVSSVICSYVTEQPVEDEQLSEFLEGTLDSEQRYFQNIRESYLWDPDHHSRLDSITRNEEETEEEYRERVYDEAPSFVRSGGLMTLADWSQYMARARDYEKTMQDQTKHSDPDD